MQEKETLPSLDIEILLLVIVQLMEFKLVIIMLYLVLVLDLTWRMILEMFSLVHVQEEILDMRIITTHL